MSSSVENHQYNVIQQEAAMNLWQNTFHMAFQQTGSVTKAVEDAEFARKAFLFAFPGA